MENAGLAQWAKQIIALYESGDVNQFILYGNLGDLFILPAENKITIGTLNDFWTKVLTPHFDVLLSYDLGNGIRVERGGPAFAQWPFFQKNPELPKNPKAAIEILSRYFRYSANLARLGLPLVKIACVVKSAELVVPASTPAYDFDLNAIALLIRDWANDDTLNQYPLVTCLMAENVHDLHPLLVNNQKTAAIEIPRPTATEIAVFLRTLVPQYRFALKQYQNRLDQLSADLVGASLSAINRMFKLQEYRRAEISASDLTSLKKELVENDCNNLIEFIKSPRTLKDLHGCEKIKERLRQDLALWKQNDTQALPMGYLLCGPVGTGKTFIIECLAGEAEIPIIKINNFRDKWIGSSEGNLERIFRLIKAIGRCFVFIDEADQALGKRDTGNADGGLSGRIYSMIAKEMSNPDNRGKIIWILASSRPDLIEIDFKRPGRIDVKIPLFPTGTPKEGYELIQALCNKRFGIKYSKDNLTTVRNLIPPLLTPAAADAIAAKIYRVIKTRSISNLHALRAVLSDYKNPVAPEIIQNQINLAINETSDLELIPPHFRH